MSTTPPTPGFVYDDHKAAAIAEALDATLAYALGGDVSAPDQLAGLGYLAARIITRTGLRRAPQSALNNLLQVVLEQVAKGLPPGSPLRPPS